MSGCWNRAFVELGDELRTVYTDIISYAFWQNSSQNSSLSAW